MLAELTGAAVHHGPNAAGDVRYADVVREDDEFAIGKAKMRVLETPGHTDDSLSFVLSDTESGDDPVAVVYPAHGAGSVCGSGMADRELSTIGYERRNNPRLGISDRDRFIEEKLAERHEYPLTSSAWKR